MDFVPELPNLRQDVERGCPFCAELLERLSKEIWPKNVAVIIGPAVYVLESSRGTNPKPEQNGVWAFSIAVEPLGAEPVRFYFEVFADLAPCGTSGICVRQRPPCADRCSLESVEILQQWISECSERHPQCQTSDEMFCPKRLIDVGPVDGSVEPRLVEVARKPSRYAALSHCWGAPRPGVHMLRTLTSSINSFRQAIPYQSMPRNFQDAVRITRALNIPYIWIDSLCIIQDSKDDWAKEGSMMDKIYNSAWVSLAATSASTSEDGFLQSTLENHLITIPSVIGAGKQYEDFKVKTPDRLYVRFVTEGLHHARTSEVNASAWNKRAWTLQERYFARRTIHFGATRMFWECREGFASECSPRISKDMFAEPWTPVQANDDPPAGYIYREPSSESKTITDIDTNNDVTWGLSNSHLLHENSDTLVARTKLYEWWFQNLTDYSRRQLTYSSDKLPGISGLAKELCSTYKRITGHDEQYVAGIWIG
ncbi:HET-domain-containing protein, partial [Lophiostoma macrostomum CBS 122681]